MLPATRGAEVLYANVLRPLAGNIKAKAQGSSPFPQQKATEGFSTAGTTAPSSFERESKCTMAVRFGLLCEADAGYTDEKTL